MIKEQGNNVLLTMEDAKAYRVFVRNRDKIITLMEAGVFELQNGKAEINMHNGQIQIINIHRRTFKRAVVSGRIPV